MFLIKMKKQKFPLKLDAGLIDRKIGKIRYFTEETIGLIEKTE